jgi:competence protein ComGF
VAAFTLLECLVALLVIAGSVSLYQGLTKVVASHSRALADDRRDQWLVFSQQFRMELEGSTLVKVEPHRLYVLKQGQVLAFGKHRADDFRKTNARGQGYQPMLFQVASATFEQENDLVILRLTFDNGLERSFVYAFEETG